MQFQVNQVTPVISKILTEFITFYATQISVLPFSVPYVGVQQIKLINVWMHECVGEWLNAYFWEGRKNMSQWNK